MIEIVTDKDRNLKNLKQIGTPKEEDKIYIENFAYARIKEETYKEKRVFILMGHTERMQGKYATFAEAVIPVREIEFSGNTPRWNNSVWNEIFREIKRLYEDMIIVGWALDLKGMSPKLTPELERQHREYFGGAHQLLFLLDTLDQEETFYMYKENRLIAKDGFYIYHRARKKETSDTRPQEELQERIPIRVRREAIPERGERKSKEAFRRIEENKSQEPDVDIELDMPDTDMGKGRYRRLMQENTSQKSKDNGNMGLAIAVAMLVFVVGVGVYENRGDIFHDRSSIETNLLQDKENSKNNSESENKENNVSDTETEVSDAEKNVEKIPVEVISGSDQSE